MKRTACTTTQRGLAIIAVVASLLPGVRDASAQGAASADSPRVTTLGVEYGYQNFTGAIDPWLFGAIALSHRSSEGTVIARVNLARRFSTSGAQAEVDAYPKLGARSYAYLNAGYSASDIFPEYRFGGELFTILPQAWEASLGFRQLRFGGTPVTLLTGSMGRYMGNYWFSARPFVRAKSSGTTASGNLTARRYYQDGDNYIGARVGFGSTPGDALTPDVLSRTSSISGAVNGSRSITGALLGTWTLALEREKLSGAITRRSWTATAGLRIRL